MRTLVTERRCICFQPKVAHKGSAAPGQHQCVTSNASDWFPVRDQQCSDGVATQQQPKRFPCTGRHCKRHSSSGGSRDNHSGISSVKVLLTMSPLRWVVCLGGPRDAFLNLLHEQHSWNCPLGPSLQEASDQASCDRWRMACLRSVVLS